MNTETRQTRYEFHDKLDVLKGDVLRLGSMVDEGIANAGRCLEDGDLNRAQRRMDNTDHLIGQIPTLIRQ